MGEENRIGKKNKFIGFLEFIKRFFRAGNECDGVSGNRVRNEISRALNLLHTDDNKCMIAGYRQLTGIMIQKKDIMGPELYAKCEEEKKIFIRTHPSAYKKALLLIQENGKWKSNDLA
jgi:hypothetical protein